MLKKIINNAGKVFHRLFGLLITMWSKFWKLDFWKILNGMAKLALACILILPAIVIFKSANQKGYIINAVQMPKELHDDGFTGSVMSNMLNDEIQKLNIIARTTKEDSTTINIDQKPDLSMEVLGLGFSTSSLAFHIREIFGIESKTINSEMTQIGDELRMTLRIHGQNAKMIKQKVIDDDIKSAFDRLMENCGRELLECIDPYRLAVVYMRENKYDQSERIIRKMIEEKNPDMDWAYSLWGRIYQMKTPVDFDKSQACFDKALEINPKFFNAAMAAGWLQFSKKDYEKAIEFFNKAHHLKPSHFGTVNGLALSNRRLGNHEAAVKAYKLNIEKHPDKLWSYGNYSDYKMNVEKDTIGASNLFREASKNLDESGDYYVTLSGMYFFQNKMDSAWMYMEKALDYDPYNVNALNQIARYHTYHTQDYATADHFYRRLYEARKVKDIESSIVASTLNVWAMNDYMSGNLDSAFVHVRKAIKVFPSNEYPYTTLAETFHYAGMVDSFFHYSKIAYDLGYDFNEAMDDEPYINYKNDPRFKLLLVPKIKN